MTIATPLERPTLHDHPSAPRAPDHRGSWIPNVAMIRTRLLELRKRRGLMIALLVVNIGVPTLFLTIRLVSHAVDPKAYGPAGGYDIFTQLVGAILYVFGFIVAATLGCSAGSTDLSDGMFRHLVVTGRSRLALYLARIPASLAIVWSMVAAGFAIVCVVCCLAAPTTINFNGATLAPNLTLTQLESWAATHPTAALCDFNYPPTGNIPFVNCGGPKGGGLPPGLKPPTHAQLVSGAIRVAAFSYPDYRKQFLSPSDSLMVETGLWIELEASVGLIVGIGLGSLLGQRTVSVVLMIVLELVLTPLFTRQALPYVINGQRGIVGLATAHLEPSALPFNAFGNSNGPNNTPQLIPESHLVAALVVAAWLIGWTAIGAWRMSRRDA